jgi:hypothetical protein
MTNFDTPDAIYYFNRLCKEFDVGKTQKAGAREPATPSTSTGCSSSKDDMF